MTRTLYLLLFFLFITATVLPQEKPTIADIRLAYESFEYKQVINLAAMVLQGGDSLGKPEINDILLMKAVSHYALAEEQLTRKTFIEMLKNDKNVLLDSVTVSPKIVAFFMQVRNDFLEMLPDEKPKDTAVNTPREIITSDNTGQIQLIKSRYEEYRAGIGKSLLLPGLGHYSLGERVKGTVIAAATLINASALIYFAIDTRRKESAYLSETTASGIKSAYSDFNTSYKIRNTLITSLALVWIYAQTDLLLFGNSVNFSALPGENPGKEYAFRADFRIEF